MTPKEIIQSARLLLNDTGIQARQSDAELLGYVHDALRECATLAPQLFLTTGDMECVPDATEQGLSYADVQALVDVIRVKGGRAVLRGDLATLSAFNPLWGDSTAGAAVNWMPYPGDPLRFYIYPKAPPGQVLEIKYVRNPTAFALTAEITDLPEALRPALIDYVVGRAEMKDDEHVNSGRATAAYQQFVTLLTPRQV